MIAAFAFCQKDHLRLIEILDWIFEMAGQITRHQCLLIGSHGMPQESFNAVNAAAKRAFSTIHFIQTAEPNEDGWPSSCNSLFRCCCQFVEEHLQQPFFWNEPDCIPLTPRFLDQLEEDYLNCQKPFMGVRFDKPWPHLTGTAVYPRNVRIISPMMYSAVTKPWDVVDKRVLAIAHPTQLIQHVWGDIEHNIAPTFPDAESLRVINPNAVVFHRCKDGSLIKQLRARPGRKHYDEKGRLNTCIVELGRYGDIINILPVARHINDSYVKPYFMVSEEFKTVLDGVSYVDPLVYAGHYSKVEPAIEQARRDFEHVIVSQVWGETFSVPHECASYNQESWRMAGFLDHWNDPDFKLIFDQRSKEREATIVRRNVSKNRKPIMLVHLAGGKSGPFADWQIFQFEINHRWHKQFQIIDVSAIICERVYDLLGLFDVADVLVTIDTVSLHLAAASDVSVVALLNDKDPTGWSMSLPRKKCLATVPYSKAMKEIDSVHAAIAKL